MDIRRATAEDVATGAAILTDAFAADPWFRWLYPEPAMWPTMPRAWFELVVGRALDGGEAHLGADGFVDWISPGVHFPTEEDRGLVLDLLEGQIGERAAEALGVIGGAGAHFPAVARHHCVYVGVRPQHQGRGIGRALLGRVLDRCDAEGTPASLSSTNDANLPFYRSLGFTEIAAVPIPGTDRSLRPMWREPA
jgi:GNAT superfamily N-acetyltransferase